MILKLLRPKLMYASIHDIPLRQIYEKGIRGLIIDLDNTITEWNRELSGEAVEWVQKAREAGLKICFVSNNSDQRVRQVAEQAGVPFVARARKPRRRSFLKAMAIMDTAGAETAVIGDQLFTDMLGGNRLGLLTILVTPINSREFIGTRLVRLLEKIIMSGYR